MKPTASSQGLATVLVTGATGFVGRQVCLRLAREGVRVIAWARSLEQARGSLGQGPELLSTDAAQRELVAALERCDAVIHLAGAGIFDRRWSAARKRELRASRVDTTNRLVEAIAQCRRKPALVSASAVGWYGPRGDEALDEDSAPGVDYLGGLCQAWERSALAARTHGVRVAIARIGIVLGLGGGALERMLPPFRLGLGGPLGSGRQWMSWIHAEDLVELLVRAARDERFQGVFNAVAPAPATNRDFTRALARALGRPAFLPAPGFALRLALGEAAGVLLTGQRVTPRRAREWGFEFRYPTLETALEQLVGQSASVSIGPARDAPSCDYLARSKPRYLLAQETLIPAPLEEVFEFFSRAENLGAITPAAMSFRMLAPAGQPMHTGREIDYAIKVGPVPMRWRSRIEDFAPGEGFVDSQLRGPYANWWHEHRFERAADGSTLMRDRVWYAPPLGPLGAVAQRVLIAPQLDAIFRYREHAIALRFGRATPSVAPATSSAAPSTRHEKGPRTLARSWA